jgi:hypothetical protein
MDMRTRLRKLVNREGYLGRTRLLLLRLIDPVEWYMRSNDPEEGPRPPRRRAQGPTGWVSYAPVGKSTSRSPERSFARMDPQRSFEDAEHGDYWRRLQEFRREHAVLLEAKARDVLNGKQAVIETSAGTVGGKLIRFRNGAVLERWETSPEGTGQGQMRVERSQFDELMPLTMDFLAQAIIGLGPDARPLAYPGR